jgi:hypothetical protein
MQFAVCALARPAGVGPAPWGPARRSGRKAMLATLLAWLLVVCLVVAGRSYADPADDALARQREIAETRTAAAEVANAVRRVQADDLRLRATLGVQVRELTAEDVTATALRLARLDAETARFHLTALDNRIAQREAALQVLRQEIGQRTATVQGMPADAAATLAAKAALEQGRELHAAGQDLLKGLRSLRTAESERLALGLEQLALLRSRAELRSIQEVGAFDQEPKVVAIRAVISRLARDAIRLDNEAATTRPKAPTDPVRKRLLELQASAAIIRSSVRVADLGLIQVADRLDFYQELVSDASIPVAILYEAKPALDEQRAWLRERLTGIDQDRLTLQGQRELIAKLAASSSGAGARDLDGPMQDVAELLDFQHADIDRLQRRSAELATDLDSEIVRREFRALREHRALPTGAGHWQLVKDQLTRLPGATLEYWQATLSDLLAGLAALPARARVGLAAESLLLLAGLWWLERRGLVRLIGLAAHGAAAAPWAALRRALPALLPVAIWLLIAQAARLADRPTWLLAAALALWPLATFVLGAIEGAEGSIESAPRRPRARLWLRACLVSAAALGALVLLVRAAPMLPSVAGLVERAGFVCLILAAFAAWFGREDALAALSFGAAGLGPQRPPRAVACSRPAASPCRRAFCSPRRRVWPAGSMWDGRSRARSGSFWSRPDCCSAWSRCSGNLPISPSGASPSRPIRAGRPRRQPRSRPAIGLRSWL